MILLNPLNQTGQDFSKYTKNETTGWSCSSGIGTVLSEVIHAYDTCMQKAEAAGGALQVCVGWRMTLAC